MAGVAWRAAAAWLVPVGGARGRRPGTAGNRLGDLRNSWQCGHQNVTRSSGSARSPAARAVRIAVPQRRHGRPGLP
jgi:hypothetical protein